MGGVPTAAGSLELGRGEYYRRKENEAQPKILEAQKKRLITPELGWDEKDFQDLFSGKVTERTTQLDKILKDSGYTGHREFGGRQALQSVLMAGSLSPKYTRMVMKQPGSKAIKHAEDTLNPSALATWKSQNIGDPMMRAIGGTVSTAGLHQAHRIPGAVESVVEGAESVGTAGKNIEEMTKSLKETAGEGDATVAGSVEKLDALLSEFSPKENIDPETGEKTMEGPFERFGSKLAEGLTAGTPKKIGEWATENRGALIGGGAGLAGLYVIYRIMKAKSKEEQRKKEAEYAAEVQAKALRKALRG
jgi:hypothetical protein